MIKEHSSKKNSFQFLHQSDHDVPGGHKPPADYHASPQCEVRSDRFAWACDTNRGEPFTGVRKLFGLIQTFG